MNRPEMFLYMDANNAYVEWRVKAEKERVRNEYV